MPFRSPKITNPERFAAPSLVPARTPWPEPVFGFLMTVNFWLLVRLAKRLPGEKLHPELLLLWASMAAAVLCKGIHGLLLPIGVLAVASIFQRTLRPLCRRVVFCGAGWLIFLALVLPWYLAIEHRYPGFILDQIGNEQANMLVSRRWPVDGDHLTFVNFWLEQFAVLFPWTLLIPGAAVVSFRALRVNPRLSSGALLLLLLCLLYAAAISFANLQDYYLLICFPVVAIWLAWSLRQSIPAALSAWFPGIAIILLGAGGVIVSNLQLAQMFSSWRRWTRRTTRDQQCGQRSGQCRWRYRSHIEQRSLVLRCMRNRRGSFNRSI